MQTSNVLAIRPDQGNFLFLILSLITFATGKKNTLFVAKPLKWVQIGYVMCSVVQLSDLFWCVCFFKFPPLSSLHEFRDENTGNFLGQA